MLHVPRSSLVELNFSAAEQKLIGDAAAADDQTEQQFMRAASADFLRERKLRELPVPQPLLWAPVRSVA